MQIRAISWIIGAALVAALVAAPLPVHAQQSGSQEDFFSYSGSLIFSIFYLPVKLVTCVGGHIVADTAYVATYGVRGNYDGGTNGKELGEVARGSCASPWVITPNQVKKDYQ